MNILEILRNVFHGNLDGDENNFVIRGHGSFSDIEIKGKVNPQGSIRFGNGISSDVYDTFEEKTRAFAYVILDACKEAIKRGCDPSTALQYGYNCNLIYVKYFDEDSITSGCHGKKGEKKPIKSSIESRELALYADNTHEVYDRFIKPTIANLKRKYAKGIYDHERAVVAFEHVADEAAKMYDKEFGSGRGSMTMFTKSERHEAAEELCERYEDDIKEE